MELPARQVHATSPHYSHRASVAIDRDRLVTDAAEPNRSNEAQLCRPPVAWSADPPTGTAFYLGRTNAEQSDAQITAAERVTINDKCGRAIGDHHGAL